MPDQKCHACNGSGKICADCRSPSTAGCWDMDPSGMSDCGNEIDCPSCGGSGAKSDETMGLSTTQPVKKVHRFN